MDRIVIAVSVFAQISCADSVDQVCSERTGTYITKYTERSGSCGPITETIITISKQSKAVVPPCVGFSESSPDNCTVTFETTCPIPETGPGLTLREDGVADWNNDGTAGYSIVEISVESPAGAIECRSTYDVELTKL